MNVWIVNHYAIPPSMGGIGEALLFFKVPSKEGAFGKNLYIQ